MDKQLRFFTIFLIRHGIDIFLHALHLLKKEVVLNRTSKLDT